jgi:hypothetical protein
MFKSLLYNTETNTENDNEITEEPEEILLKKGILGFDALNYELHYKNLNNLILYNDGFFLKSSADGKSIEFDLESSRFFSKRYDEVKNKQLANTIETTFNYFFSYLDSDYIQNIEFDSDNVYYQILLLKEEIYNIIIVMEKANDGLLKLHTYYKSYWRNEMDEILFYKIHINNSNKLKIINSSTYLDDLAKSHALTRNSPDNSMHEIDMDEQIGLQDTFNENTDTESESEIDIDELVVESDKETEVPVTQTNNYFNIDALQEQEQAQSFVMNILSGAISNIVNKNDTEEEVVYNKYSTNNTIESYEEPVSSSEEDDIESGNIETESELETESEEELDKDITDNVTYVEEEVIKKQPRSQSEPPTHSYYNYDSYVDTCDNCCIIINDQLYECFSVDGHTPPPPSHIQWYIIIIDGIKYYCRAIYRNLCYAGRYIKNKVCDLWNYICNSIYGNAKNE